MTLYIIRGETVTARASSPTTIAEGEVMVRSAEDIETSALSKAQFAAGFVATDRQLIDEPFTRQGIRALKKFT